MDTYLLCELFLPRWGGRGWVGILIACAREWEYTILNSVKKDCGQAQYHWYSILNTATLLCLLQHPLRACLKGGRGPQVGQATCGGSPTYHVNVIKLKWEIIWAGGLPHLSGLLHLPGVPHLVVNRPLVVLVHPFLCYVAGGLLLTGIRWP